MQELVDAILVWTAAHPGWVGLVIALVAFGESLVLIGMVLPGAALMIGFGALVALGAVDFGVAWACASAGAIAGDGLSFALGRVFRERLSGMWPLSRYPGLLERGRSFVQRHGGKSVVMGRFVGPLRAVVPAVAGMLHMPFWRFTVVNVLSAVLWAPAYLLPGMVVGASLALAGQVAWRLVVLLLVAMTAVIVATYIVRTVYRFSVPRLQVWMRLIQEKVRGHAVLERLARSLFDPAVNETPALIVGAFVLLLIGLMAALSITALTGALPTPVDRAVFAALNELRTPWGDRLMIVITQLGDWPVKTALAITVFIALRLCQRPMAAWYWLAASGFAVVSGTLFKSLFAVSRPNSVYEGISQYAFPSNHATMIAVMATFLALLLARSQPVWRRLGIYLVCTTVITTMALSRLYLGAHWLTDTLGGACLGTAWALLLAVPHRRHGEAPVPAMRLTAVIVLTVALVLPPWVWWRLEHDLARYAPVQVTHQISTADWRNGGWADLPQQRSDLFGEREDGFIAQWVGPLAAIESSLGTVGWQKAPPLSLVSATQWLNPQASVTDLPALPQVHEGREPALTMVRTRGYRKRDVLRLWDSAVRLDGNTPVWLAQIEPQVMERYAKLITILDDIEPLPGPSALPLQRLDAVQVRENPPLVLIDMTEGDP